PPAQVTLDPDTANANLYLSDDCRDVWWEECKQRVPSNPRRFVGQPCVLGSTGFTSGQHRWEVQVCRQGVWAIGVAKQSVPRKGLISLSPKEGIWALQHHEGQRHAPVFSFFTHLRLPKAPRLIQVTLDYQEGRVEFFDAVTAQKILGFPPASFKGEKIYPFFLVQGDTHLKIL
ncbi:BT3A3 protein, partial [Chauna torquata]|nr:BT3A3 protein [Chauna torquata]